MENLRQLLTLMLFILLSALFEYFPVSVSAQMPGVSFSPAVIDFGRIPSHEQPTQLLTVTFDRSLFLPGHLPSLRVQGPNGPVPTLFSRSVTARATTLIYRIKLLDDGQYGPFQYHLVLVKNGSPQTEDAAFEYVVDTGVTVRGEAVQGLEGSSEAIDFGAVRYGKAAVRGFAVGFYHSNFISASELAGRAANDRAANNKGSSVLTFQTGDGYFLVVPVTADLSGPGYPIPRWEPGLRKKH